MLIDNREGEMDRQLMYTAPHDRETNVVLYYLPNNEGTPYVTWIVRKDNPRGTFWGHYFMNLEDAEEDFKKRQRGFSREEE